MDSYAISKSAPGESKGTDRDQSALSTVLAYFADFVAAFSGMILKYFMLLAQVIEK